MFCPNCSRFTLPIDHISQTGRVNKLCCKCLKKERISNFHYLEDIESINSFDIFPKAYFLLYKDDVDLAIQDFGNELSNFILDKFGYKFRYIAIRIFNIIDLSNRLKKVYMEFVLYPNTFNGMVRLKGRD